MRNFDSYFDPPEDNYVYALQHRNCGCFVKKEPTSYVPPKGEYDDGQKFYYCKRCRREVPESEIREISA